MTTSHHPPTEGLPVDSATDQLTTETVWSFHADTEWKLSMGWIDEPSNFTGCENPEAKTHWLLADSEGRTTTTEPSTDTSPLHKPDWVAPRRTFEFTCTTCFCTKNSRNLATGTTCNDCEG